MVEYLAMNKIRIAFFTVCGSALISILCTRTFDNPYDPTSDAVPDAPASLSAKMTDDKIVVLTWHDKGADNGFSIFRDSRPIGKTGRDDTLFLDTAVSFETNYIYWVQSTLINGNTSDFCVDTFSTVFKPCSLRCIRTGDSLRISWMDRCSFETGFVIEQRDSGGVFAMVDSVAPDDTLCYDRGLIEGLHQYRVKSMLGHRSSEYGDEAQVRWTITDTTISPAVPSNFTARLNPDRTVALTWTDNGLDNGFIMYRDGVKIGTPPENSTGFSDSGRVDFEKTYTYVLKSRLSNGRVSSSVNCSFSTAFMPINFRVARRSGTATGTRDSVTLSWGDPCSFEDGFIIEQGKDSSAYQPIDTVPANDTAAGAYSLYDRFRIRAFWADTISSLTPGLCFIDDSIPLPPAVMSDTIDTSATVWIYLQSSRSIEDGYTVTRNGVTFNTLTRHQRYFSDTAFAFDTVLIYDIRTKLGSRLSEPCYDTIETWFTPTSPKAAAGTNNAVQVSWTNRSVFSKGIIAERKKNGAFLPFDTIVGSRFQAQAYLNTTGVLDTFRLRAYSGRRTVSRYTPEFSCSGSVTPDTVVGLRALVQSSRSIKLSWWSSQVNDGFLIVRNGVVIDTAPKNATEYTDADFPWDTILAYTVSTILANGSISAPAHVSVGSRFSPLQMRRETSPAGITLRWRDSSKIEKGFIVERKAPGDDYSVLDSVRWSESVDTPRTVFYLDARPVDGTSWYRVRSFDYAAVSNACSLSVAWTAPPSNANFLLDTAARRALLRWTDNSGNETGMIVERQTDSAAFERIDSLPANTASMPVLFSSLDSMHTYRFRVRAKTAEPFADSLYPQTEPSGGIGLTTTIGLREAGHFSTSQVFKRITPDGKRALFGYDFINLPSGTVSRQLPVEYWQNKDILSNDCTRFAYRFNDSVRIFNTETGLVLSNAKIPGTVLDAQFSPDNAILFMSTADSAGNYLQALDAGSGNLLWIDTAGCPAYSLAVNPSLNQLVSICSWECKMTAFNRMNGSVLWALDTLSSCEHGTGTYRLPRAGIFSEEGTRLITLFQAITGDDVLMEYGNASNGSLLNAIPVQDGFQVLQTMPGGKILIIKGTFNQTICALSLANGTEQWSFQTGGNKTIDHPTAHYSAAIDRVFIASVPVSGRSSAGFRLSIVDPVTGRIVKEESFADRGAFVAFIPETNAILVNSSQQIYAILNLGAQWKVIP
jgi:hypothetical protein